MHKVNIPMTFACEETCMEAMTIYCKMNDIDIYSDSYRDEEINKWTLGSTVAPELVIPAITKKLSNNLKDEVASYKARIRIRDEHNNIVKQERDKLLYEHE